MYKRQLVEKALRYLHDNKLMTVGTSWHDRPWSATVFFAYTEKFDLIFFSKNDTRHCKNIRHNSFVSVAINQDWGRAGAIKGMQILGQAASVPKKAYRKYYTLYHARYPWADEFPDHHLYIVKPLELHYIDEKFFGHFFRIRII